jgi:DNA-binding beta-propeller fold protein YncE
MRRATAVVVMFTVLLGGLTASLTRGEPTPSVEPPARRLLPGLQPDGFMQLPNQWRLRPSGAQIDLGDFPVHCELHPEGKHLAVLHCGYREHEVAIISLVGGRNRIVSRASIDQGFYGLAFSPDGKSLYCSGGEYEIIHAFDFLDGYLANPRQIRVAPAKEKFVVGGVTLSVDGSTLFATGLLGNALVAVPARGEGTAKRLAFGPPPKEGDKPGPVFRDNETDPVPGSHDGASPYAILAEPGGKRLFVSLWNHASIAVIDTATFTVAERWPTASHPTEMALRSDGKALYVSCSNSTLVSVLDPKTGKQLQTLNCALYPTAPVGNTPASLTLSPDNQLLFVANADCNNIAVFNASDDDKAVPLGFIPAGWYPTCVRYSAKDRKIYYTNGKGTSPRSNRHGPQPGLHNRTDEYIAGLYRGTLGALEMPTPAQMERFTRLAYQCSPLRADLKANGTRPADSPIPANVGDPSPIKYCIYIVKENRTYDQVFGDMKEGNGDPSLCLFPEAITPNHHALAREFVLLDNTYVESEVSADGHEWSMAAYATDFVEKTWPLTYRTPKAGKLTYPAEGSHDRMARSAGGYIWDRAIAKNVSFRTYGEWVANGKKPGDPGTAAVPAIEGRFDPLFRSFDMDYPDQKRADRFISELQRFEKEGEMPRLQIVRLPNDHTAGTRVGKPTPTACVADNDLALGRVVEALSKSKFWPQLAIFVVEDDAQNGPDHVDAHRAVSLVISPYCKRQYVDSTMYSTSSVLRTMELILGLDPMSQFDAAATPMWNSFRGTPDLRGYAHRIPKADLNEVNLPTAFGAAESEKFDLTKEDAADDLRLNEVIWRSIKGRHSPMPAPVRAAFVRPRPDHDDDD